MRRIRSSLALVFFAFPVLAIFGREPVSAAPESAEPYS
jgi:hypothetical protein